MASFVWLHRHGLIVCVVLSTCDNQGNLQLLALQLVHIACMSNDLELKITSYDAVFVGLQYRQGVYISREDRPSIELADGMCASREVWETALRQCVLQAGPNIRLVLSTAVKNLLYTADNSRVTGEPCPSELAHVHVSQHTASTTTFACHYRRAADTLSNITAMHRHRPKRRRFAAGQV